MIILEKACIFTGFKCSIENVNEDMKAKRIAKLAKLVAIILAPRFMKTLAKEKSLPVIKEPII